MRIVILTSETPGNVWLTNQLLRRHDVAGIVIERRPAANGSVEKRERRRRLIKRYGLLRTVNKLLYNRYRASFFAERDARVIREAFFPDGAAMQYVKAVPTVVVSGINDASCIQFIQDLKPDLLAVCGTTVLKPDVFNLAPRGTINIHTGITPEYRSADPIFWALYCGEPEKVGVTIHYIDRGIDTGPIIHQESVPVFRGDSLASLYVRCVRRGAQLYSQALTEIEQGVVQTVTRPGVISRAFLSVDLGLAQYFLFRWRFWRLGFRLPTRVHAAIPDAEGPR